MKYILGLKEIIDDYDGFIIDLWGVVHNGQALYPGVADCLQEMKSRGKIVVLLSNAPRRISAAVTRLREMGLDDGCFDGILTSGEVTHAHLKIRPDAWYKNLGTKCFHIGATKDQSLFEEEVCERVEDVASADFILNSGIERAGQQLEDFENVLQQAIKRHLPMICANPDLIVHVGGVLEHCAGAIAQRYKDLGGDVRYHGKPHGCVYERIGNLFPKGKSILAIGDAMATDVRGAIDFGIDSAFVGGGIHNQDLGIQNGTLPSERAMDKLCKKYGFEPTYVVPGLVL